MIHFFGTKIISNFDENQDMILSVCRMLTVPTTLQQESL